MTIPGCVTNRTFFSDRYLETRFRELFAHVDDDSRRVWSDLRQIYLASRPERFGAGLESQLREEFIDRVLDALDWERSSEGSIPKGGSPDYALFISAEEKQSALDTPKSVTFFDHATVLVEAKSWNVEISPKTRDDAPVTRQTYGYIESTHVRWGIATNGRDWLLLSRDFSQAQGRVFAIDLSALLKSEEWSPDFNYFYLTFSRRAFAEGILDLALRESVISGEAVGNDLKKNVYEALLLLGRSIARNEPTLAHSAEGLREIKESSLALLYRLLFVNFAESRRLVPMEESDIYRRNFSLQRIKESVRTSAPGMLQSEYDAIPSDKVLYTRKLRQLFHVIDRGSIPAKIPPYNGGLFEPAQHPLLEKDLFDDRTLARVVDLLSRSNRDPDRYLDYSYLGVRELGSIYEGLLEYDFGVSGDTSNELELRFSGGERKVTGSYYTPEPVVSYIVANAVGPLVDSALKDAGDDESSRIRAILGVKVVDPSMGSGHFLVAAVEYLASRILREATEETAGVVPDKEGLELEDWAKREVAVHCIFGVDLNPMAVELAKVSLWLTTFSRDKPLSFLDSHLQRGNSIIGTWTEELPSFPSKSNRARVDVDSSSARVLRFDISGLLDELKSRTHAIEQLPEDTAEQVGFKKREFTELRDSQFFRRLWIAGNLRTGIRDLSRPEQVEAEKAWDELIRAVPDAADGEWRPLVDAPWAKAAARLAESRNPFHWELAFPEIFTSRGGGFDAVIGNPPYVRIYRGSISMSDRAYFQRTFASAHMKFDLYLVFFEQALRVVRRGGRVSMIIPDKVTTSPYGEPLRKLILRERLESVLDLRGFKIFKGVSVSNIIPLVQREGGRGSMVVVYRPKSATLEPEEIMVRASVPQSRFLESAQSQLRLDADFELASLQSKLQQASFPLREAYYVNWGLRTGTKERSARLIHHEATGENPKQLLRGEDVRGPYVLVRPQRFIEYIPGSLYNPMFPELFENPKILFRKISGKSGMMAVVDESRSYCFSTLICVANRGSVAKADWLRVPKPTLASRRLSDPYLTLAICNSSLIRWWYRQTYSDNLGVNPNHVKAIPLPKSLLSSSTKEPKIAIEWSSVHGPEFNLEGLDTGGLESVVAAGARKLQQIGNEIGAESSGFASWLQREFGDCMREGRGARTIASFELQSGEKFLMQLKGCSPDLSRRLQDRTVQERLLREHGGSLGRLKKLREDSAGVSAVVERAIHRLFGLTQEESAAILKFQ